MARVKRLLPRGTKVGHTGTLDPLASGLLILVVGRATRLSRYVMDLPKSYAATARFGARSDTLDAEGNVTPLPDPRMPDRAAICAAAERFKGDLLQTPPMASAVKVGGERLYRAHRRGEEVERQPRPVTISSFDLTSLDGNTATFEIRCSSGTYVRSLVADLADSLGTAAYLTALRRGSVGGLRVENAASPDDLDSSTIYDLIIQSKEAVAHLPVLEVSSGKRALVCSGRSLGASGLSGSFRVEWEGELLAVYRDEADGVARPEVVLCAG